MEALKAHVQRLYEYNSWANWHLLDKAADLSAEQFVAPTRFPHESVRRTLVHILFAEWIWRKRCEGHSPLAADGLMVTEDFPDVASLRAAWEPEMAAMQAYLVGLRAERLAESLHYKTTRGVAHQNLLQDILSHVVVHGMQHRSEVAQMLTEFGHSPGDIDYILWARKSV